MDTYTAHCPRTDESRKIPGHYMNSIVGNSLPSNTRSVTILTDRKNPDLIAVVDSEYKANETWFFHNAFNLGIDKAMEAYADFREKVIYTRSMGSQNYKSFYCASNNALKECPDLQVAQAPIADSKPKSFFDKLGYDAQKNYRQGIIQKENGEKTVVVEPHAPLLGSSQRLSRPSDFVEVKENHDDDIARLDTGYITGPHFHIPKRPSYSLGEGNVNVLTPSPYPYPQDISGNAQWIPAGKSVLVHGIEIPSGMIYLGSFSPTPNPATPPPSPAVINLLAPANTTYPDHYGNKVGYWPSYSTITAEARAGYLYWLSGSKDNSEDSISWVFLYFYGLERRVVVDGNSPYASVREEAKGDLLAIRDELVRLRHVYGEQGSFNRYSEDLIHLINLMGNYPYTESLIPTSKHKGHYPWEIRVQLGQLARDREPLPAALALTYARSHPTLTLPKPAVRCAVEFDALFSIKYRERYGFGMALPILKRRLVFKYVPSITGSNIVSLDSTLPDIASSLKLEGALHQLVEECANALSKYSRFLASNPDEIGSVKALSLLPTELLSEEELALVASSKSALKKNAPSKEAQRKEEAERLIEKEKVVVPVVLDHILVAEKEEETKKVSALLHDILSDEPHVEPILNSLKEEELSSEDSLRPKPWLNFELDESHWKLMLILASKEEWTQVEFAVECKKLHLLPNGALDTLNEAAIEYRDEPLTDTDSVNNIIVDLSILKDFLA